MQKNKKKILALIFILMVMISLTAVTYAFFMGGVNNDNPQTAVIETGTMRLTFADNDAGVSGRLNFGDSIIKKFTLENTGTVEATVDLYWKEITNSYLNGSLMYTLEYSTTETGEKTIAVNNFPVPVGDVISQEKLATQQTIPSDTIYYYTLTITLVNSETVNQTSDINASFASGFTIESVQKIPVIELETAEDIYTLSRLLAQSSAKNSFIYTATSNITLDEDLNYFDIPEIYSEESDKIAYLQSASYKLMNDVELTMKRGSGTEFFLGIGTNSYPFLGRFNGNRKTITLSSVGNIQYNGNCDIGSGLFGRTENAAIYDLNVLVNNNIIATRAVKELRLGVVVGQAYRTKFNNCSVTILNSEFGVKYSASETYKQPPYVGGLVGFSSKSIYNNCEVVLNNSSIIAEGYDYSSSTVQYGMFSVGGMIGFSTAGSDNSSAIGQLGNQLYNCNVISNNTTNRNVIYASVEMGQEITVGGLVGCTFNNFVAKNCYVEINNGNIVATKTGASDINSTYGTQAGGIIGRLEHTGEINNCHVKGNNLNIISKSPNNTSNVGGIVGVDIGPYHRDIISINNCTFDGSGNSKIALEITSNDDVVKYVGAGGIVGTGCYKISNCSVKDTLISNKADGNNYWPRAGSIVGLLATGGLWKNGEFFTPNITTSQVTDCTSSGVTFDVSDNVVITK